MRTHTIIDSPVGALTLVATDGVLDGLYMRDHARMPDPATFGERAPTGFERAEEQLAEYFAGTRTAFTLDTAPRGTAFQRRVWDLVAAIPYGRTRSYAQLAEALGGGDHSVTRAVGTANGRNPLCVIVPCHRVVGSDGSLTGYAGGLARKRYLLDLEAPAEVRLF
ncbi:methylated-DNA-[protein]-cysteine S-methyltransferase [Spinactinospora alkalitolerans]|uniref:Methylated-DNA--protein-cysteine methyltransferase n=1 Tax=Spinactinospora alkalitolerans TaxID=687207 RepID=A0A852TU65_9ACTN|nr:methylated-DNA--[protein]-cysteine S-methyltransferase [Spinactinospora alkalitolerans]NYE47478.1 methylated-DNA-[protein]-cysteine S-methyltransferase [Spinactinospora alkalitolerans]